MNIGISVFAAFFFSFLANQASAACYFYDHRNYDGILKSLGSNWENKSLGTFNDRISSVRVGNTCTATVNSDSNYTGTSRTITANTAYLGDTWNDVISSVKCSCASLTRSAILYSDRDFKGRQMFVSIGMPISNVTDYMNDLTSSVKVPKNCELTLYVDERFKGNSIAFKSDTAFIGNLFNDLTSAAVLKCK